ncbi:unnamed protein product, partial [Rotaria sp. Silwood2]
LLGVVLPIISWVLWKKFPNIKWLALINFPIILATTINIPPAPAAAFTTWFLMGFIFNFILYRYAHEWWEKYAYVFSAAMSCGVAICGFVIFIILQNNGIEFPQWWGTGGPTRDGCPLEIANYSGFVLTNKKLYQFIKSSIMTIITDLFLNTSVWTVILIVLPILYYIYYRKFRIFIFDQPEKVTKGKVIRGKCPPSYPNGWFWLIDSCNLARGDVKFIQHCGRDVVLFRGHNGKPYVLEAYCSHMGGNLGIGGKVRDTSCIECPFHGWAFDGETGTCVFSYDNRKVPRKVDSFKYIDVERCTPHISNDQQPSIYLQKIAENQETKLRKYECREMNGSIFAWYHAIEELRNKPLYELIDIKDEISRNNMEVRGESINYVNCHIQEIPENGMIITSLITFHFDNIYLGSDIRHFDFLHDSIVDSISFIKFKWSLLAERASTPNIREIMKHSNTKANAYKMYLFDRFLKEDNLRYINVMSLDCSLHLFNKYEIYLFNTTGFQIGPSIVYLFLWSPYFKLTFFHTLTPLEKFHQRVVHRIITSKWMPYWLSTLLLMGEVKQLYSDMKVWNHKIFSETLNYNIQNYTDQCLHAYRNWYAQFYDGCYEREAKSLFW